MRIGSGAWCWFADPRAVVAGVKTFVGWIDSSGDVRVATLGGGTATLHTGLGVDDHNNPALLVRADGRLQAFYSAHGGAEMFFRLSSDGERWDAERRVATNTPGTRGFTYPNPVQLVGEQGRIHLFWRGGDWNPAFSTSPDGLTWAPAQTLIRVPGQRPYVKVASDGLDTIHVAFTDGHPRETATSLYYARYSAGAWHRAGGERIGGPPWGGAPARGARGRTPTACGTWPAATITPGCTTSRSTRRGGRGSSTRSSARTPTIATATPAGRARRGRTAS